MKKTLMFVASLLMLFSFASCNNTPSGWVPPFIDPDNPIGPVTPQKPSIPDDKLEDAVNEIISQGGTLNLEGGNYSLDNTSFQSGNVLIFDGGKSGAKITLNGDSSSSGVLIVGKNDTSNQDSTTVEFRNVDIVAAGDSSDNLVYIWDNGFKFEGGSVTGNGNSVFGIVLTVEANGAKIDGLELNGFKDAGINVSTGNIEITNCSGSSPIIIDIPYDGSTMKIEGNSCPIWLYPSADSATIEVLKELNPEAQVIAISKTPSTGSVDPGNLEISDSETTTAFLQDGSYSIAEASSLVAGSSIIGSDGTEVSSSAEITVGVQGNSTVTTLQNMDISSSVTGNTRVLDVWSPIVFENGTVTTTAEDDSKTTIAIALNNSTAGSVIRNVEFSGMVCAVNISTADFILEDCVAEEGSKFYMDVPYVEGSSQFINCRGLLEMYAPNVSADDSEQERIKQDILKTSPDLEIMFVDK